MSYIEIKNINKKYKNNKTSTLSNFSLDIEKGEFIVIVGPSGSGKSTLLELICGFEDITDGNIKIDNKVINEVPPKNRDVSMVFQNYAIYPHLTTYENIAFGMKIRKVKKVEIDKKVRWASNILGLDEHLNKKPHELSGGQRQRVAIARSMVREPKLFLMDEPLSNLDSKLRYSTANEISNLHKKIGATTIYVTHDQVEALTMADRIVVLNEGEIQQVGTPLEIYKNPKNTFVASFIGKPQINLHKVRFINDSMIINDEIKIDVSYTNENIKQDTEYILGIRPEDITNESKEGYIKASIDKVEYLGSEIILYMNRNGTKFIQKTNHIKDYEIGEELDIKIDISKSIIFDIKTRENLGRVINEKKNSSN